MSALPQPPLHRPITITTVYPPHNTDDAQHQQAQGMHMHEHDYYCRTATSPERQLPSSEANMICPAAPRKLRRAVLMRPRKRRLLLESEEYYSSDLESPAPEVITVSMEELEAAFRRRRKPAADSCCSTETNGNCRTRKRYISTDPSIN